MIRSILLAGATAAVAVLAAAPAHAQAGPTGRGIASTGFQPPVSGVGPKHTEREAPPPGIPGALPRTSAAPPAAELDVPPTEALFDAINRGDMNLARDSLNRGADFNGRNVLGMTPLELSIDLSRNDITFLLLSLRTQATVSGPPQPLPPAAGRTKTAAARAGGTRTKPPAAAPAPIAATTTARAPNVAYASVPANPVPQAGFLGFGATATP